MKLGVHVDFKGNGGFSVPLTEWWYDIPSFIRNVDKAIDSYFSVKTTVSIQSEEGVCLTAIILAHTGDAISFLDETKFVHSIQPQTVVAQSRNEPNGHGL